MRIRKPETVAVTASGRIDPALMPRDAAAGFAWAILGAVKAAKSNPEFQAEFETYRAAPHPPRRLNGGPGPDGKDHRHGTENHYPAGSQTGAGVPDTA